MKMRMSILQAIALIILWTDGVCSRSASAGSSSTTPRKKTLSLKANRKGVFDTERKYSNFRRGSSGETGSNSTPRSKVEVKEEKIERSKRIQERRKTASEQIRKILENPQKYKSENAELMSDDDVESIRKNMQRDDPNLEREENRWLWNSVNKNQDPYNSDIFADPDAYYDPWAQAYRMLGSYIECKSSSQQQWYYGGNQNNNNRNNNDDDEGCKRWVIWAAYVNPNYEGYGLSEYMMDTDDGNDDGYSPKSNGGRNCQLNDDGSYSCGNNSNNENSNENFQSSLNCHDVNTEWKLLGVYRQNFYDYFEQISKHLWYYNSFEYQTAISGLEYIGDADCEKSGGSDEYGNYLYKAPRPLQGGGFEIGLYTDYECSASYENDEVNADNLGYNGNNKASGYYNAYAYDDYYGNNGVVQEYTLTLFNEVYEDFKYCTLCMDYPSYQDGYFNGDGVDDDDLVNQCWKFHSHDSYTCDTECLATASGQGTINLFKYGDRTFGTAWNGSRKSKGSGGFSFSRAFSPNGNQDEFYANLFLMASALIFFLLCLSYYNFNGLRGRRATKSRKETSNDEGLGAKLTALLSGNQNHDDQKQKKKSWFSKGREKIKSSKKSKSTKSLASSKSVKSQSTKSGFATHFGGSKREKTAKNDTYEAVEPLRLPNARYEKSRAGSSRNSAIEDKTYNPRNNNDINLRMPTARTTKRDSQKYLPPRETHSAPSKTRQSKPKSLGVVGVKAAKKPLLSFVAVAAPGEKRLSRRKKRSLQKIHFRDRGEIESNPLGDIMTITPRTMEPMNCDDTTRSVAGVLERHKNSYHTKMLSASTKVASTYAMAQKSTTAAAPRTLSPQKQNASTDSEFYSDYTDSSDSDW